MSKQEENQRAAIFDAIRCALEVEQEEWLLSQELSKTFGMFTKSWLDNYGKYLGAIVGRTRIPGAKSWAYPRHKIARMIATGELEARLAQFPIPCYKS